jgi:hypothetical protein
VRLALVAALAAFLPMLPATPAAATTGPALAVDASADRYAIDPDVYGMNDPDPSLETELGMTVARWGGNATSRYSYMNNTTNLGSDWYFENYVLPEDESLDATVKRRLAHGTQTVVTVPMIGFIAKDSPADHPWHCGFSIAKYGPQTGHDEWDTDCGNGVRTDGSNVTDNDALDTSERAGPGFAQGLVEHLVQEHGEDGVRTYELDNEPALWNSTHRDVHPDPVTYDELAHESANFARAIWTQDPDAEVAGPSDWGWCTYFFSAADPGGCQDGPDRQAHDGVPMAAWYLRQMKAASDTWGVRLLDVFDEHYYAASDGVALAPAGSAETQALRLRSTRSLWDPAYVDESWIGRPADVGAPPIRLIPWMRETVAAEYPGTKTSISEYNWGGLESMNGALAQADVLGIFGRERLDRALLWDPPSPSQPGAFAFRMYRDYDGAGSRYGDTWVRATSSDQDRLAVYASQRTNDGAVTVMVVNKTGTALSSPVALSGAAYGGAAQAWSYSPADLTAIHRLADVPVAGGAASTTFAANSITLLVIPTGPVLTAAMSPNAVTYGTTVTATGRLTAGGAPLAGTSVMLQAKRAGTTSWVSVGYATSAADGTLSKSFVPQWSASLRWVWGGSSSPAAAVTVRGRVSSALSPATVARGGTVRITGSVAPAHPGARVALQQWSGSWRTLGYAYLTASGTYALTQRPTTAGTRQYRVWWMGDTDHAPNAGPTLTLKVV